MCVLAAVLVAAVSGCPAPAIDENPYEWSTDPYEPVPLVREGRNPDAPTCTPDSIVDLNRVAWREGNLLRLQVDTSHARNDMQPGCTIEDSAEVMLRYRSPALAEKRVRGLRISTVTPETIANGNVAARMETGGEGEGEGEDVPLVRDPTTFDTVVSVRLRCDAREVSCNDDAIYRDVNGRARATRRSTVYHLGMEPEEDVFIMIDGRDGSRGIADVRIEELVELGRVGQPCEEIPPQRVSDPTTRTAFFRCPYAGVRCSPGAAPDGTDLCLPVVPLGALCDREARFVLCERADEGAECAENPMNERDTRCAMPGTAPGTSCRGLRGMANRCDAGLACSESPEMGGRDLCVTVRTLGETCDPVDRGAINRCDTGLECCAAGPTPGETTYCRPVSTQTCYRPPMD